MDIGNSAQRAFDSFFEFLPNLLGFLLLLVIGYIVAKIVAGTVSKVLEKMGLDKKLHESEGRKYVDAILPGAKPSNGIAMLVFWLIFAFFILAAISALKIPAVTDFMNQVLAYLPNVIVAILIFVVAALISGAVAAAAANFMGDTPTGKIVGTVAPALVMVIALFMILDQLKIAEQIVSIAFAATMGALALGLALAFGLGGRDVARRMLEDAYSKGQDAKEQAKKDAKVGRERAQDSTSDSSSQDTGAHTDPAGYQSDPAGSTATLDPGTDPGTPRY